MTHRNYAFRSQANISAKTQGVTKGRIKTKKDNIKIKLQTATGKASFGCGSKIQRKK